jgi:flagellar biosynthesis/type III secretory pathway chaperone
MDRDTCRTRLARLLSEENALLATLAQQLTQEHGLLAGNDVDGLEKASGTRQQTIARLLRVEDERQALCRQLGRSADRSGMAALLTWCDPDGTLAAAQSACATLAGTCRAQNERNGALVTARLTRASGMLDLLAGSNAGRTYDQRFGRSAPLPAGRMLATSA